MAKSFRCSLCNENVDAKDVKLHHEIEDWILETIKECNPGWVEPDGSCPRCIIYYKNLPTEPPSSLRLAKKGE